MSNLFRLATAALQLATAAATAQFEIVLEVETNTSIDLTGRTPDPG